jgi:hypothetical protein
LLCKNLELRLVVLWEQLLEQRFGAPVLGGGAGAMIGERIGAGCAEAADPNVKPNSLAKKFNNAWRYA